MGDVYIDFSKSTGTLTGTWTFTNGASLTAPDGDAQNELDVGDYVRQSDGIQWYEVTAIPDADTITISPLFQQATHTDDAEASLYNDTSASGALNTDYCHHRQATTDTVRTAGDIVRTRGGLTYTYAGVDIVLDDNGAVNSYIEIRGIYTAAGDDSWGDGDTTRPILDFGSTDFNLSNDNKDYWKFTGLDFKDSDDARSGLQFETSWGCIVDDCRFYDNGANAGDAGIRIASGTVEIRDCVFSNNFGAGILLSGAYAFIIGCTFDGDGALGVSGQDTLYGLWAYSSSVYIKDCTFGVTDDHVNADVYLQYTTTVRGRNLKLDSATEVIIAASSGVGCWLSIEDNEQTHLAYKSWQYTGTVERSTAVERSGGGGTAWSMRMIPEANCGSEQSLYGVGDPLRGLPIYLDGTAQTITMYCYATSWAVLPTVSQFGIEVEHYEGAADWAIDETADTFAANDQWESFSITLTPGAAGPAYLRIYLKDYEDGTEKIYIDPTPVIS